MVQFYLSYSNNQYSDRNKMKKQKIPHCSNSSKIQQKNHRNTGKNNAPSIPRHDTPNTQTHDRSLYWLGKNMKKKDGYLQRNLNKNKMDGLYTIYFKRKTNTYNFSDW